MTITAAHKPWLTAYPDGVPEDIDASPYRSLLDVLDECFDRHASRPAFGFLGKEFRYADIDRQSRELAAYLQGLGLVRGDRVAVMMPNVPQYPVAVAAILRAGYVVVNVNPLYTPRELEYQLKDSGAQAIIIIENFAATLSACLTQTPVKHIVLCSMGDMLGTLKGAVVNYVVRHVKNLVPPYQLPQSVRYRDALVLGARRKWLPPVLGPEDAALLQYTGGTTGVSKGAVLLHRNLVSNLIQADLWLEPVMGNLPAGTQATTVCALPMYHIFAFTVTLLFMRMGGKSVLIPNPRDLPAVFKELKRQEFHCFPAVNTLFNALAHHPDFGSVDWSPLRISIGGGMSVHSAVAKLWLQKTGNAITEAYGLSETSPLATANPVTSQEFTGTIGVPVSSTSLMCVDDEGREVLQGQAGEIVIRGPQVMAGYWQRPDETAKVMLPGGWFRTGDIGIMDEHGYFRIVDRKKDMILVSGFNVYPNEIEDVVSQLQGVLECAVVGIPDEEAGEAVKLIIVKKNPELTEQDVRDYCHARLTGYKRPKVIEFRSELPKTPVGKILRRELRQPS